MSLSGLFDLLVIFSLLTNLLPMPATLTTAPPEAVGMVVHKVPAVSDIRPGLTLWSLSGENVAPFDRAHDVPFDRAHDVTVASDVTWYTDTLNLGDLTITDGAVLTLAGPSGTYLTVDDLRVTAGARLVVSGTAIITATNFTVEAGASLSADGLGYSASAGPGAGTDGTGPFRQAGGGGHGGWGGAGRDGRLHAIYLPLVLKGGGAGIRVADASHVGGQPYDADARPKLMGSGGGSTGSSPHRPSVLVGGGAGGGALRLVVSDTLTLNGVLSANGLIGGSGDSHAGGGGAGGSLWIETGTFTGSGVVNADGGDGGGTGAPIGTLGRCGNAYGQGGGGAGGRVAIYASNNAFTSTGGTISVVGGSGYESGGVGTIYVSTTATGPVTADFAATPISGSAPLTVTFTNHSTPSDVIEGYEWDFGDGSTLLTTGGSTLSNTGGEISMLEGPTHVYTQTGSFTVTLTATVGNESAVEVKSDYISVTVGTPVTVTADFTATPTDGNAPLVVVFSNRSTSSGETCGGYAWDFGDGSTLLTTGGEVSTLENPIHVYTRTGVFTVTLTATAGGKSAIMTDHISVTALSLTSVRAPQVSIVTPVEGTILGEGEVWVTGVVSDDGTVTGVWVASVPARGNDIPATLTDNTFSVTITLEGGNQTIHAVAQDDAGALGFASRVVRVDGKGPKIEIRAPRDRQAVHTLRPTVSISYTDFYTHVNPASLRVLLVDENGASSDVSGNLVTTLRGAQGVLSTPLLTDTVYTLSVSLADALGNASAATATLYVPINPTAVTPPRESEDAGWVSGVVHDSSTCDEHLTTCRGLSGAQVTLAHTGSQTATITGTVLTGPDGFFAFPVSETGHYRLRIEKEGYTYAQRQVTIVKERSTATDAIYLTPLDLAVTWCDEDGCSHTSADGRMRVQVPPGAIPPGGQVQVTATAFERAAFLPSGELPPGTWETFAFNLGGDSEVAFLQPITVHVSNTLGFSPGTPIPLGYWNQASQAWEHAGTGVVDASGAWVEMLLTHFSNYDCNDPIGLSGGGGSGHPAGGGPPPPCPEGEEGCFILYRSGALREWVDLPPVSVLGRSVAPQLRYSTRRANPSAVIDVRLDLDVKGDIEGDHIGWELYIEGEKTDSFTFAADLGHSGEVGRYRYYWDGRNAQGERLPPGVYDYKVRFTLPYTAQYCYALDGVFGNPPDCENGATGVYVEAIEEVWTYGTVVLPGEPGSPWGSGWLLGGQERLYESEEGRILVVGGQSEVEFYFPWKDQTQRGGQESLLAWVNADGKSVQTLPESLARNWLGTTVEVGERPQSVAVSPDGAYAYVADDADNTLSVLNLAARPPQVVGVVEFGNYIPNDVVLSPDGARAYVASVLETGRGYVAVVDLATLALTDSVQVGRGPRALALSPDGARAYVTNNGDDSVSVVNLQSLTETATIAVGTDPIGITLSPDGTLGYVVNEGQGSVSVLDLATLTLMNTINVGSSPRDIAASSDGRYAYVTNYNDDSLSVLDLATLTLTDTIDVGDKPQGMALSSDGQWAYVVNRGDNSVSLVDLTTRRQVITIGVGEGPEDVALSPDGEYAYVANWVGGSVSAVDLVAQGEMTTVGVGPEPHGVAISPDRTRAYVTNYDDDNLSVVDLAAQQHIATVPLDNFARPRGIALSPSGTLAYVVNFGTKSLSVVDLVSLTITGTAINVGGRPYDVAISPDGEYAYVTSELLYPEKGKVAVVSLTTTQKLMAIAVGDNPHDIVLSPDGGYAYVTNSNDDNVSVVDLRALTETATIAVGNGPRGIALSPDGAWAYVANHGDDNISVVDLEIGEAVDTIPVGDGPEGIVLSSDGEIAYVTNSYNDDNISVVDLTARQQVKTIGVGDRPLGIALWGAPPLTVHARTPTDHSTLTYNAWRDAYTRTYPDGRQVHFNPDGTHDYTLEPDGLRTAYTYHPDGTLASMSITAPGEASPRWTWTFDYTDGRLSSIGDPTGRTTSLAVDDNGHLAQVAFPDGAGRSFLYDARGLMTQQVDGEGHVTDYVYDTYGRIKEHVGPQRAIYNTETGKTTAERETRAFTPSDTAYPLINDSPVGDPEHPAPAVPTSTLMVDGAAYARGGREGRTNEWGNWLDETDALGRTTTYARDAANNLTGLTWPAGNCVEAVYDAAGNPVSAARMGDEQCNQEPGQREPTQVQTVTLTYEARFNQVKTIVDPLSRTTTYYYDYELGLGEAGKLVRIEYPPVTDENGVLATPVVSYTYNDWGLLETQSDEGGAITRYAYTQSTPDEAADGANPLFAPGVTPVPGLLTRMVRDDGGLELTTTYKDFDATGNAMTVINPGGENVTRRVFDAWGRVVSQTSLIGVVTLSEYDGNGRLVRQVTDAGGNEVVTEYEYDAQGQLVSRQTSADGQVLQTRQAYDVNGKLASERDSRGNQTLSVYDEADQLVRTIDPAGRVISYTYDLNGRLESTTNAAGAVSRSEYDDHGRLSRSVTNWEDGVFDPAEPDKDVETRYRYDAAGNTILVTDTLGRMTRTFYDDGGRTLGSIVNWDGSVTLADCASLLAMRDDNVCTLYAYDLAGRTVIVTDTLGRMTRTFYDVLGRVQATVINWNPGTLSSPQDCVLSPTKESVENVCTLYGYDAAGNRITTTNALNQTNLTVYDEINRPIISVANWDGTPITGEMDCAFPPTYSDTNLCAVTYYNAHGQRSATRDPLGNLTEFDYDSRGRLITTTRYLDDVPVVTVNHYDALGNRVGQTDAMGYTTTYIYDDLNRLAATVSAEDVVTVRGYDAFGRVVTTTDSLGHQTLSDYDILGRRVAVTDAENNVTRYAYDALGNQVAITDANGVRTSYLYDGLNRLSAVIENDTGGAPTHDSNVLTQYVYDVLGNRIVITNALGYTSTQTTYDVLGRPTVVEDALGHQTRTQYNALGYRTVVTDANDAVTRYSYDGLNRLISVQYANDGMMMRYSYDALGNRTAMTDTLGVTRYVYDDLYRLISVSDPFTGTVSYGYDLAGNRTQLIYPDGQVVTYTYDAGNRLVQVEDWSGGLTGYEYDVAGCLITTTLPNGVVTTYRYDAANRLIDLAHTAADGTLLSSYSYELDGTGNRVRVVETLTEATRTITYTYDHLYRLTEADYSTGENFQYAYEAVGNRTTYTTTITQTTVTSYSYDAADRLVRVGDVAYAWDDLSRLVNDGTYTYTWNATGRLITVTNGVDTLGFRYDGDGNRLARIVNGTLTVHTLDIGLSLPKVLTAHGATTTWYLHLPGSVAMDDGTAWSYSTTDGLGSVRQQVNGLGQVVNVQGYRPFGSPLEEDGGAPYGFTGEWWEAETELLYLRARYYGPGTGRFLSQDLWPGSAWQPRSANRFAYVMNNPINASDPTGMVPQPGTLYSCRCGFIDLDHCWPETAWRIIQRVRTKVTEGSSDYKAISTGLASIFPPVQRSAVVSKHLSEQEQDEVALGIFMDLETTIEDWHLNFELATFRRITKSGYALEDLPSDLISFYMAWWWEELSLVQGIREASIRGTCRVLNEKDSRDIYNAFQKAGLLHNKNYYWGAYEIPNRCQGVHWEIRKKCGDDTDWPADFSIINPELEKLWGKWWWYPKLNPAATYVNLRETEHDGVYSYHPLPPEYWPNPWNPYPNPWSPWTFPGIYY